MWNTARNRSLHKAAFLKTLNFSDIEHGPLLKKFLPTTVSQIRDNYTKKYFISQNRYSIKKL